MNYEDQIIFICVHTIETCNKLTVNYMYHLYNIFLKFKIIDIFWDI